MSERKLPLALMSFENRRRPPLLMRTFKPKLSFAFRLLDPNPRDPWLRMKTSEPTFRSALISFDPKRKPGRLSMPTLEPKLSLALISLENPKSQPLLHPQDDPGWLLMSIPELEFPLALMLFE